MVAVTACELLVGGMTCAACTGAIQRALLRHPGVLQAQVDIVRETARIAYDSGTISPEELCAIVQLLGFKAQVLQIFFSTRNNPQEGSGTRAAGYFTETLTGHITLSQEAPKAEAEPGVASGCTPAISRANQSAEHLEKASVQSTATIRLLVFEEPGSPAARARSSLESTNGVLGCTVVPMKMRFPGTQRSKQLVVTYNPKSVGARRLLAQLKQQGFQPQLLGEDPLDTQKQAVLDTQKSVRNSLLISLLPTTVVLWLSVMGRTHSLPAIFLYEVFPGIHLSTILLLLLSTPIQFYGGRFFHMSALKGLKHGHLSMDLLVSLGSTLAFVYSVISCIQAAATSLWCRPLLTAGDAAAVGGEGERNAFKQNAFQELIKQSEPPNFFDTCAMLICVLLLGKLLQLRAKARILTQLHSLHKLQACKVHMVVRSTNKSVAMHLLPSEKQSVSADAPYLQKDALLGNRYASAEAFNATASYNSLRWWHKLLASLWDAREPHHKYNPLSHPGIYCSEEHGEESPDGRCCRSNEHGMNTEQKNSDAANDERIVEVVIRAELLQIGDVVRVPPHEVFPADGVLLAPDALHVDEKLISGESKGITRLAGQKVIGGSRNASHKEAFVRVEVVGDASVLQTLLRLVHTGQQQQVPVQKVAEVFVLYFIPAILCIAVAAVAAWTVRLLAASETEPISPLQQMRQRLREAQLHAGISEQQQQQLLQQRQQQLDSPSFLTAASPSSPQPLLFASLFPAAAVLSDTAAAAAAACRLSSWVVAWDSVLFALRFGVAVCCAACPCAIGLAAPAAVAAATAAAAARGVFFKSGNALETAAKANVLVLDKTGTLTTGELQAAACALHLQHLRELLLPKMREQTNLHQEEAESLVPVVAAGVAAAAAAVSCVSNTTTKRACCCSDNSISSSTTNSGRSSSSNSTTNSSMASEVPLEETEASPRKMGGTDALSAAPFQQKRLKNVQQPERQSVPSSKGADSPLAAVAFLHLREPSHAPTSTSGKETECCSSGCSESCCWGTLQQQQQQGSSSSSMGRWQGASGCCSSSSSSSRMPQQQQLKVETVAASEKTLETSCFLWALSCLEQGSSHSVGEALTREYERWRTQSCVNAATMQGKRQEAARQLEGHREVLPPPKACQGVEMLPRGLQGLLCSQNEPPLRLRVMAAFASAEDEARSCCSSVRSATGLSAEDTHQLEQWTKWHESHTGPVVHLYASISATATAAAAQPEWRWLGSVALSDKIKEETKLAVNYLRRCLGFDVFMCTGDNPRTAARVAAALDIPSSCVRAQQTPEDKVKFLRSLVPLTDTKTPPKTAAAAAAAAGSSSGSSPFASLLKQEEAKRPVCCMIGDGLNDSPALAEAALGVAFGVGNALPLAAADVAVGGSSWTEVIDLFRIARKMRRIIQWNFVWACAFNLIAVPLAAGVAYPTLSLHPAAAAAAMAGSCLLVLLNAQRLSRFQPTTSELMVGGLSQYEAEKNGERGKRALAPVSAASEASPQTTSSLQETEGYLTRAEDLGKKAVPVATADSSLLSPAHAYSWQAAAKGKQWHLEMSQSGHCCSLLSALSPGGSGDKLGESMDERSPSLSSELLS